MMDILDRFIGQARKNLQEGYYDVQGQGNSHKRISLTKRMQEQEFSLIAEIKHASPAGEYCFDFIDVENASFVFKKAGADAISVVVEPKIFKGSLENIPIAKKSGLPVLFKDFVIDEKQINAAAFYGADCILLILKVASRLGLNINQFIKKAHSFGLEVLLECYDAEEMKKAIETDADILGINNRDLRTLDVDLNRTFEIAKELNLNKINKPIVSESGIKSKADAEFLKCSGIRGVLVGTALWKTANQAEKIKELKFG